MIGCARSVELERICSRGYRVSRLRSTDAPSVAENCGRGVLCSE